MAKKRRLSNKKIQILIFVLIILTILIYAIIRIFNLIKNPTDTFLIENGKLSSEDTVQGYVIREEEIIKGENYKNGMEKIKIEGEKVAKGEAIFRYYTSGEEKLIKQIQELDIKIAETIENEGTNLFPADIKLLENQIQDKINNVYKSNDIQKIKEIKNDMNSNITKKAKIAGELSPSGSYLKELIKQRSEYENRLNSGSEYLTANKAGIVSYRVDGLEDVLTPNNFGNLSKKLLEDLKLKTGQIISTSEERGKIINNFECYIACILNSDKLSNVKAGDTLKIRLSTNKELDAKIDYISKENENESLIVFKIQKYIEELINYRKISFDIIWWNANGLKVPNEAVKQENEKLSYIIRQRNGYSDKIYVKILKQNESYSIVDNYSYNELIEKGLSEVEAINMRKISVYDEIKL